MRYGTALFVLLSAAWGGSFVPARAALACIPPVPLATLLFDLVAVVVGGLARGPVLTLAVVTTYRWVGSPKARPTDPLCPAAVPEYRLRRLTVAGLVSVIKKRPAGASKTRQNRVGAGSLLILIDHTDELNPDGVTLLSQRRGVRYLCRRGTNTITGNNNVLCWDMQL